MKKNIVCKTCKNDNERCVKKCVLSLFLTFEFFKRIIVECNLKKTVQI